MKLRIHSKTSLLSGATFYAYNEAGKPVKAGPLSSAKGNPNLILEDGTEVTIEWITEDQWMALFKEGDFVDPLIVGKKPPQTEVPS